MRDKNNNTHDNWKTPKYILDQIREEFGEFFDPCPVNSDFNGLEIDWKDVNYINPPYSLKMKTAFVKKAVEESKKGKVCIMLIPVSTSTKLFHEDILPNADEIRFVKGRINFNGFDTQGSNGKKYQSGQMDSMVVIFRTPHSQTQANSTSLSFNNGLTENVTHFPKFAIANFVKPDIQSQEPNFLAHSQVRRNSQ